MSDDKICTRCRAVMTYEPDDEATTVCHSCAYVALDEMGRELAEAQSRITDLERDLAAAVTAQTADGERAADREVERLQRERNEARCNAEDWADACAAANAQLLAVAEQFGTTDTTNLADRVRARLAGQDTAAARVPVTRGMLREWENGIPFAAVGDQYTHAQRSKNLVFGFGALLDRIDALSATVASFRDVLGVGAGRTNEDAVAALRVLVDERQSLIELSVAGQETQTEHVITESARRMFEAAIAGELTHDLINGSHSTGTSAARALSMARLFAETEAQERARIAPGARNGGNHD